jgi:predicted enzyme related to lactoylglutathione lyase
MTIIKVSHITIYVDDQDEALTWYQEKLGFETVMDNREVVQNLRWLTVSPKGNSATQFVLMPARSDDDKTRVGNNLMTVLSSDDCTTEMRMMAYKGVEIVDPATEVPWGVSGIIKDLYGNYYNIVGPK